MAEEMVNLAEKQPGYLGRESVLQGIGSTLNYWDSLEVKRYWMMVS